MLVPAGDERVWEPLGGEEWRPYAACFALPAARSRVFTARDTTLVERMGALEVCQGCPVWRECYRWARESGDFEGIAGGACWPTARRTARRGKSAVAAFGAGGAVASRALAVRRGAGEGERVP